MDGEPALAMTVARRYLWVNIKGDWYYWMLRLNFLSASLRANLAKLRVVLDCFLADGIHGWCMARAGETTGCNRQRYKRHRR
jgi:hypothetical protein